MEKYIELYKKYRPRTWDDIIGQDEIIKGLREVPITGQVPTAYMFFGGHGCGKTSTALVLAKSLNCEHLQENGNPCNKCDSCIAIDSQSSLGVNYISMANQGTAEDVRKIVDEAQLAKPGKKQVWILDECHRLSATAFDALLIPLESERTSSLFIFCSTEPNKIPKTILSRCQTRNFRNVDQKTLVKNVQRIAKQENLKVTKEQFIDIVRNSNGSVRDSIRNLETIVTDGTLPEQFSGKVLKLTTSRKFTDIYKLTNEMAQNGQSFTDTAQQLYRDLASVLVLLSKAKPEVTYATQREVATILTPNEVIKYLSVLGDSITNMSNNVVDSRVLFEIALTKIVQIRRMSEGGK